LPNLLAAFPQAQFVVASHNPFVVGSVPQSNVYVLRYGDSGRVVSTLLDTASRAGTANEILRDVLGLEYTLPLWVEGQLEGVVAEFVKEPITADSLGRLRERMKTLGLEKYVPETIAKLADSRGGAMIALMKAELPAEVARWLQERQSRFIEARAAGQDVPESLLASYRDPEVKAAIRSETCDKCAYCESKILHVDHGDVEHILPKSLFPQYRLTYSNLTFVCKKCNQAKSDYHNPAAMLLNPCSDAPGEHLVALGPMVAGAPGQTRGFLTVRLLQLNRTELLKRRKERIDSLMTLIDRIVRELDAGVREALIGALLIEGEQDKEYSFVARALFTRYGFL
jgi:uncharacterized protein with PIN domain